MINEYSLGLVSKNDIIFNENEFNTKELKYSAIYGILIYISQSYIESAQSGIIRDSLDMELYSKYNILEASNILNPQCFFGRTLLKVAREEDIDFDDFVKIMHNLYDVYKVSDTYRRTNVCSKYENGCGHWWHDINSFN